MTRSLGLLIILACSVLLAGPMFISQAITVEVTATVPGCGDAAIGSGEQCDGVNLNGSSCVSLSFAGGSLSCTSACTFNTSSCTSGSGGGGGGGGGGASSGDDDNEQTPSIPDTNVVFTGRAYASSTVTLLKDAQVVATVPADDEAEFQATISGLSGGDYLFSVYSEDVRGIRSSLLTFPVYVAAGQTTKVSNIFVAPTIGINKVEVQQGDEITIYGQSAPLSVITTSVNSETEYLAYSSSNTAGVYETIFDTEVLELGQHYTKSAAAVDGDMSAYGKTISFVVGTETIEAPLVPVAQDSGDLNNDQRVNIVDFSLAAYWYQRANPPAGVDVNSDGLVDLKDFSIMMYHWTG